MQISTLSVLDTDVARKWRAILAEFLSTVLLIFFGCSTCLPVEGSEGVSTIYSAIGFGMVIMFIVQIFAHISGSLMNPGIAIMAVVWNKISFSVGIAYIIAECAGAIVGYGLLMLVVPFDAAAEGFCVLAPKNVTNLQGVVIEMMLTMILSLITASVFDPVNAHNSGSNPFKFGFAVTALALAGATTTGASMNPARSLGPAVWTNRWDSHWIYWVGPLIGGALPGIFYKYIWLQPKQEEKMPS